MSGRTALDTSVYRLGEPQVQQQQCSGIECVLADILEVQLLVVATIAVTALTIVAITYLRDARETCSEEQSRLRTERAAFERFRRRIASMSVTGQQVGQAGHGGTMLAQANAVDAQSQLRQVRDAYEETVMSVPHYEEDYGESIEEHLAAELGEELAVAVVDGDRLTPQIQRALVAKSKEAQSDRTAFLRTLDREAAALADAQNALSEIDGRVRAIDNTPRLQQSFSELYGQWDELNRLEADCEDVLDERQSHLQTGAADSYWREDGHKLCTYLYESLPVQYPVLADGTALLDRIQATKRRVAESLARRV